MGAAPLRERPGSPGRLRPTSPGSLDGNSTERSLSKIFADPLLRLAVGTAALSNTVMCMYMAVITIKVETEGYTFSDAITCLEMHFFAMFAPSFFTGSLIEKLGTFTVNAIGVFLFVPSIIVFISADDIVNIWVGMLIEGLAWNLTFTASTVLLTRRYMEGEGRRVQAVNDFIVFGLSGLGAGAAGYMLDFYSWSAVLKLTSFIVLCLVVLLAMSWKNRGEGDQSDDHHLANWLQVDSSQARRRRMTRGGVKNEQEIDGRLSPFEEGLEGLDDL